MRAFETLTDLSPARAEAAVREALAAVDPHDLMDDPRLEHLTDDAAGRRRAAIATLGP
jgi:hypothetical protein